VRKKQHEVRCIALGSPESRKLKLRLASRCTKGSGRLGRPLPGVGSRGKPLETVWSSCRPPLVTPFMGWGGSQALTLQALGPAIISARRHPPLAPCHGLS